MYYFYIALLSSSDRQSAGGSKKSSIVENTGIISRSLPTDRKQIRQEVIYKDHTLWEPDYFVLTSEDKLPDKWEAVTKMHNHQVRKRLKNMVFRSMIHSKSKIQ